MDVLVGFTGLVGSNFASSRDFDLAVNSRNSEDLRGGRFGHVVFSAAKAEKWRANADPTSDARHVDELIDLLGSFTAERLTLVSTVDVYGAPRDVDEDSPIDTADLHTYGANRYRLELAAASLHDRSLVLRLPALFGPGLKKNVVYDLLNDNQVEKIQPRSEFQYYDLTRLADDVDRAWQAELGSVNLVTEPVTTAEVMQRAFDFDAVPSGASPIVRYDVRTRWGEVFGQSGSYVEDRSSVLDRLSAFVRSERAA